MARKKPGPEELRALLRERGLRSTAPRLAVLAYFHAVGGRKSHAEIVAAFAGRGFDRATLYRVLVDLAEVRVLSRSDQGDHVWRFELSGPSHDDEHPHFVCIDCGDVACLPGVTVKVTRALKAPKAIATRAIAVHLRGRCDACS